MTTKIKLTAIIGIVLSLLLSCTTEWTNIAALTPDEGELVRIIAYADGVPLTKTGLVDKVGGGKSVVWKSGNAISMFFNSGSNGGNRFTTTTNGPIAEFVGSITAVSGDLSGVGGQAYLWGVYPYKTTTSCDGESITTSLPANQKAYQGEVADDLLVTVGRSENFAIHFKNTCSVIGFTVSQENIKKIVFSGNANEPVAGEFKVSFDENDKIVDTPTANAVTNIIITPEETDTFVPGVTYYFAILPNQFSAGYSITFTKSDNSEATFIREDSCTFEISTFYKLTNKDEGLTFTPTAPADDFIVFADDNLKTKLVAAFDTDSDGEISYSEAAAVTSIEGVFGTTRNFKSFDEFQYFTGVTSIPNSMFANWYALTSIVLPESIQLIGSSGFSGCSKLSSIRIPDGVVAIYDATFLNCYKLTSVYIPESVTWIGGEAFSGCNSLTSIAIPDGVPEIAHSTFYGCNSLASVVIPASVGQIGADAFYGCSSLSSLFIPDGVTWIGGQAFSGCSSLISIVIPDGVPAIYHFTFQNCSNLTSIVIPESVASIGDYAFDGCSSLSSIFISEGVSSIGRCAFYGCSSLTSIIIPESVTSIGEAAFSGCSSLTSIVIPESVTVIGKWAFSGCESLVSIVIPNRVHTIEDCTFVNCHSLSSVVIPESVISIGERAFEVCCLTSVVIPNSVSSIGADAFYLNSLTAIVIPESVTSIGSGAFGMCSNLTNVEILALIPPSLGSYCFVDTNDCPIYVPASSLSAYLTADGWSDYADRIQAIQE